MKRWVKLYEDILEWEWSQDPYMMALWSRLLVMANYKDKDHEGITIKRGQVYTSLRKLSQASGLSIRRLRTCLAKLEATQEVTQKATHRYTLITICNYDKYQSQISQSDTLNDTDSDTQATHNNRKKENNIDNSRDNARARTHEKVFQMFFEGQIAVEAFCKNNGIDLDTCKRLAREVLNDWELTGQAHQTESDARHHFLYHLRRKVDNYKNSKSDDKTDSKRRGTDTSATRTEDYEEAF